MDEWSWHRRYRVWEASRKAFLFPENWVEPERRPVPRLQVEVGRIAAAAHAGPTSVLLTSAPPSTAIVLAQRVAQEVGRDLYRVDLSRAVSKFVGETEKNLEAIFAAADGPGVVLLMDEADALLGKRSTVNDAHDRYANADSVDLLQRIESFEGLAIVATNRRDDIDDAVARRFAHVVDVHPPIA
jgi:SpoVK/Ycf46/Vps4 family AAA+-type ATPase